MQKTESHTASKALKGDLQKWKYPRTTFSRCLLVLKRILNENRSCFTGNHNQNDLVKLVPGPAVQDSVTFILCHVLLLTVRVMGQMFVISRSFMGELYHPFSGPLQFNNNFIFCLQARRLSLCQRHFYFSCHGPRWTFCFKRELEKYMQEGKMQFLFWHFKTNLK